MGPWLPGAGGKRRAGADRGQMTCRKETSARRYLQPRMCVPSQVPCSADDYQTTNGAAPFHFRLLREVQKKMSFRSHKACRRHSQARGEGLNPTKCRRRMLDPLPYLGSLELCTPKLCKRARKWFDRRRLRFSAISRRLLLPVSSVKWQRHSLPPCRPAALSHRRRSPAPAAYENN